MSTSDGHEADHGAHEPAAHTTSIHDGASPASERNDLLMKAAAVGVVGVGVAIVEVALIPGVILGAAAVLAPKYVPMIGEKVRPFVRSTVKGAYSLGRRARTAVAEAKEKVSDMVAEVHAEEAPVAAETHASHPTPTH